MATATTSTAVKLPTHVDLPESDGRPVENFLEHPLSILLTDSILPVLQQKHGDGRFAIGQNSGIYWKNTDPPLDGCKVPDWYYVPDVEPTLEGHFRRSYVLWQELVAPVILLEFASGDDSEESDRTPGAGKFWVYERVIRAPYYGVFNCNTDELLMHRLLDGRYVRQQPNERGHFTVPPMGVELGVWHGHYLNEARNWLRWFNVNGQLLPTGHERADQERQRAERLALQLRNHGISPE